MNRARSLPVVLSFAGLLAAGIAGAQFVHLSRCQAALPCSIPFGLQYRPDPLIAGPYSQVPTTALSVRVEIQAPLKIEVDRPIDQKAIDEAVRKTLELHGSPRKAAAPPAAGTEPPPADVVPPKVSPPKS